MKKQGMSSSAASAAPDSSGRLSQHGGAGAGGGLKVDGRLLDGQEPPADTFRELARLIQGALRADGEISWTKSSSRSFATVEILATVPSRSL